MMAAITAAAAGEKVILFEKGEKLGRKILISGNGRCNITNRAADDVRHYHGARPDFLRAVLAHLPLAETVQFFSELGIEMHEEKRGRLFPNSNQAQSVVDVMEDRLRLLAVDIRTNSQISALAREETYYRLALEGGGMCSAERVVLASGGISVAQLGADRSGIDMAVACGHEATVLLPGLVALESDEKYLARMQGVKVQAEVEALLPGRQKIRDTDDLLFAQYGVSGFSILNLSARIVPHLQSGPVELRVNLFPARSPEEISELLRERWLQNPHRSLEMSFAGLLNGKLVRHFLEKTGFSGEVVVAELSKLERWRLAQALTSWPIIVHRPRPFDHAEVTIGGVCTDAVNPHTLESYIAPGLYFAGEMLEVHGDLGMGKWHTGGEKVGELNSLTALGWPSRIRIG
jgi:predicted Rossmann fold flavoprotein